MISIAQLSMFLFGILVGIVLFHTVIWLCLELYYAVGRLVRRLRERP